MFGLGVFLIAPVRLSSQITILPVGFCRGRKLDGISCVSGSHTDVG